MRNSRINSLFYLFGKIDLFYRIFFFYSSKYLVKVRKMLKIIRLPLIPEVTFKAAYLWAQHTSDANCCFQVQVNGYLLGQEPSIIGIFSLRTNVKGDLGDLWGLYPDLCRTLINGNRVAGPSEDNEQTKECTLSCSWWMLTWVHVVVIPCHYLKYVATAILKCCFIYMHSDFSAQWYSLQLQWI